MADETELAARLDEMVENRWAALRVQARRDAAMALIDANGSVTNAEIDERLSTHTLPSRGELRDAMARKAQSRLEVSLAGVEHADEAIETAKQKKADLQAQIDDMDADIAAAETMAAEVRDGLAVAQELVEYTSVDGDAAADEAGTPVQADAAPAGAESGA